MSASRIVIGHNEQYQRLCRYIYNQTTASWDFHDWDVHLGEEPPTDQPQAENRRDSAQPRASDSTVSETQAGTEHQSTYWNTSVTDCNSQSSVNPTAISSSSSASAYHQPHATSHASYRGSRSRRGALPRGQGAFIQGEYVAGGQIPHYEMIDPSYYVRARDFFTVGRVFAVMWNETASGTIAPVDYTTSTTINSVKYSDNYVYTNVRRFVVVKTKPEFCFACPIFTYSNKGTKKNGVRPAEHAIVHTWGYNPQLLHGETGITKEPISVVRAEGAPVLSTASRIYFGIHHPIQYNVRVKDIGYVAPSHVPTLIGNWREEDERESRQT